MGAGDTFGADGQDTPTTTKGPSQAETTRLAKAAIRRRLVQYENNLPPDHPFRSYLGDTETRSAILKRLDDDIDNLPPEGQAGFADGMFVLPDEAAGVLGHDGLSRYVADEVRGDPRPVSWKDEAIAEAEAEIGRMFGTVNPAVRKKLVDILTSSEWFGGIRDAFGDGAKAAYDRFVAADGNLVKFREMTQTAAREVFGDAFDSEYDILLANYEGLGDDFADFAEDMTAKRAKRKVAYVTLQMETATAALLDPDASVPFPPEKSSVAYIKHSVPLWASEAFPNLGVVASDFGYSASALMEGRNARLRGLAEARSVWNDLMTEPLEAVEEKLDKAEYGTDDWYYYRGIKNTLERASANGLLRYTTWAGGFDNRPEGVSLEQNVSENFTLSLGSAISGMNGKAGIPGQAADVPSGVAGLLAVPGLAEDRQSSIQASNDYIDRISALAQLNGFTAEEGEAWGAHSLSLARGVVKNAPTKSEVVSSMKSARTAEAGAAADAAAITETEDQFRNRATQAGLTEEEANVMLDKAKNTNVTPERLLRQRIEEDQFRERARQVGLSKEDADTILRQAADTGLTPGSLLNARIEADAFTQAELRRQQARVVELQEEKDELQEEKDEFRERARQAGLSKEAADTILRQAADTGLTPGSLLNARIKADAFTQAELDRQQARVSEVQGQIAAGDVFVEQSKLQQAFATDQQRQQAEAAFSGSVLSAFGVSKKLEDLPPSVRQLIGGTIPGGTDTSGDPFRMEAIAALVANSSEFPAVAAEFGLTPEEFVKIIVEGGKVGDMEFQGLQGTDPSGPGGNRAIQATAQAVRAARTEADRRTHEDQRVADALQAGGLQSTATAPGLGEESLSSVTARRRAGGSRIRLTDEEIDAQTLARLGTISMEGLSPDQLKRAIESFRGTTDPTTGKFTPGAKFSAFDSARRNRREAEAIAAGHLAPPPAAPHPSRPSRERRGGPGLRVSR